VTVGGAAGNRAAVAFDDLRADKEPETAPGNRAHAIGTIASLEDAAAFKLGYADTTIADADRRVAAISAYLDIDVAAVRRVFDRVADQILEHPLDAAFVIIDHHRL